MHGLRLAHWDVNGLGTPCRPRLATRFIPTQLLVMTRSSFAPTRPPYSHWMDPPDGDECVPNAPHLRVSDRLSVVASLTEAWKY